jgi:hypothetical protein
MPDAHLTLRHTAPARPSPSFRATYCAKGLRVLLWVGVAHALFWAVLLVRPYPVLAQRLETRVERNELAIVDLRVLLADVNGRMNAFAGEQARQSSQMAALDAKLSRFLEGLVGLFVAIVGALLTILWSLRKGWLQPPPDRIIT